jgi:hypothetical protein
MGRRLTSFLNHKAVAWAGIAGIGIILVARLDGLAVGLTKVFGVVACKALVGLLPYLVPAAWHALQALAFHGQSTAPCPVQMLVSLCPLVHAVAGAA